MVFSVQYPRSKEARPRGTWLWKKLPPVRVLKEWVEELKPGSVPSGVEVVELCKSLGPDPTEDLMVRLEPAVSPAPSKL